MFSEIIGCDGGAPSGEGREDKGGSGRNWKGTECLTMLTDPTSIHCDMRSTILANVELMLTRRGEQPTTCSERVGSGKTWGTVVMRSPRYVVVYVEPSVTMCVGVQRTILSALSEEDAQRKPIVLSRGGPNPAMTRPGSEYAGVQHWQHRSHRCDWMRNGSVPDKFQLTPKSEVSKRFPRGCGSMAHIKMSDPVVRYLDASEGDVITALLHWGEDVPSHQQSRVVVA